MTTHAHLWHTYGVCDNHIDSFRQIASPGFNFLAPSKYKVYVNYPCNKQVYQL